MLSSFYSPPMLRPGRFTSSISGLSYVDSAGSGSSSVNWAKGSRAGSKMHKSFAAKPAAQDDNAVDAAKVAHNDRQRWAP